MIWDFVGEMVDKNEAKIEPLLFVNNGEGVDNLVTEDDRGFFSLSWSTIIKPAKHGNLTEWRHVLMIKEEREAEIERISYNL